MASGHPPNTKILQYHDFFTKFNEGNKIPKLISHIIEAQSIFILLYFYEEEPN
jgi:hypothetical protein